MKSFPDVRPSPIAGTWYSADPHHLAESVDGYIHSAGAFDFDGEVVAIVAPHAGHRYSGPVAGYAFAAIRSLRPDLVAVISPLHDMATYPLLTTAHAAYETPLGSILVDQKALEELETVLYDDFQLRMARIKHDQEHSLEIELPFLQRALAHNFDLLPVMVHDPREAVAHALGLALARVLSTRNSLLVASTDLSHFQPQPVAESLDHEMLRRVEAFDPLAVLKAEEDGVGYACGKGALAAVMWAAKALGADHAHVLHYATSGDVNHDYRRVVGYGAAVFTRPADKGE